MKKYSQEEIISYLTKDGFELDGYTLLKNERGGYVICCIAYNLLFMNQIEDNSLYLQVIDFLKSKGRIYNSMQELKEENPSVKT